jgi:hypothetical protein
MRYVAIVGDGWHCLRALVLAVLKFWVSLL